MAMQRMLLALEIAIPLLSLVPAFYVLARFLTRAGERSRWFMYLCFCFASALGLGGAAAAGRIATVPRSTFTGVVLDVYAEQFTRSPVTHFHIVKPGTGRVELLTGNSAHLQPGQRVTVTAIGNDVLDLQVLSGPNAGFTIHRPDEREAALGCMDAGIAFAALGVLILVLPRRNTP